MVKFQDFSNVLAIAFALNAFVSYIQDLKTRSSREITRAIREGLKEFRLQADHDLYPEILKLKSAASQQSRTLQIASYVLSAFTFLSSLSALAILIYAGFRPLSGASFSGMTLILSTLFGVPVIALGGLYILSRYSKLSISTKIVDLVPQLEAAGLNRDDIIRIRVLAKQFSGIRVSIHDDDTFASRIKQALADAWSFVRGRKRITLDGESVKTLQSLSQRTGDDPGQVAADALGFMKYIADHPENYLVVRDKDGHELKRIPHKEILESWRHNNQFNYDDPRYAVGPNDSTLETS